MIQNGADLDIQDTNGQSALIKATIKDQKDIVAILIESGANLYLEDKIKKQCAFKFAQNWNRHAIIDILHKAHQK